MRRALSTLLLAAAAITAWSTDHNVTIKAQPTNATIKVGELTTGITAASGSTVTLTITPTAGYFLKADQITDLAVKAYTDGSNAQGRTRTEPDYINVTVTPGTNGNYTFTMPDYDVEVSATVTPLEVTLDPASYEYTGSAISPTVKIGTVTGTKTTDYAITYDANGNVNVRDGVTATITGTGDYWGTASKSFNITKKALTITANDQTEVVYDGTVNAISKLTSDVTCATLIDGHTLSTITLSTTSSAVGTYAADAAGAIVPSGATIIANETDVTANYNITYVNGALTIIQRPVTISGITSNGKIYDTSTNATATLNYSNIQITGKLGGEDLSATATGTFDSADAGTTRTITLSDFVLTGTNAGNYVLAGSGHQTSITGVTISKATPVITTPPTAAAITYGQTLNNSELSGGTSQNQNADPAVEVEGSWAWTDPTTAPNYAADPQKFSVTFTPTNTNNYNSVSSGDDDAKKASVTVSKKTLTITARPKSITYGDAADNDGVTYSGFKEGEDENTDGMFTGALAYAYNTQANGDGTAYAVTSAAGTYYIIPSGLESANYAITYVAGELTVGKKEIGLTWSEEDIYYTAAPQAPTATATGLANSDVITVTVTGQQTNAGTGYTATASELTGTMAASYKLPDANTKTFDINKTTPVIVTPPTATPATIAYGDALSVSTLAGGSVQNQKPATPIAVAGTWAWTAPTTVPGGGANQKFSVTFTPTDTDNYNTVSSADDDAKMASITVSQHNLTITANPKTITYGDAPDNAGVTYSGFLGTDNASSLGGTLTYTYNTLADGSGTPYAAGSDIGTYKIIPAGLTSANYTITFVAGDLTVEKKAITITANDQTIAYGGAIVATEGAENGWTKSADVVEGQTLNVTLTPTDANAGLAETKKTIVPTATITNALTADVTANYDLTLVPAVLTETVSVPVANGWTTYWQSTADLKKPDTELTPYIVTNVTSEAVTAAEQTYIQKNTPYLLYYSGTAASVNLEVIYNQTAITGMDAKFKTSSNINATSANNYYVLRNGSFVWSQGNIPAGKCYIDLGTGAGARHRTLGINTGDGTTDINSIEREMTDMEGMYDLQGRKVTGSVRPGIYIKNGKKVFIK